MNNGKGGQAKLLAIKCLLQFLKLLRRKRIFFESLRKMSDEYINMANLRQILNLLKHELREFTMSYVEEKM